MALATDLAADNQRNYQKLLVSIEASEGMLNLLIAVCDDLDLQQQLIQRYETELQPEIRPYRLKLNFEEPSLRQAIIQQVENDEYLCQGKPAVLTLAGAEALLPRLGSQRSEQEKFFGYLQWTREGLLKFPFPVVLWMTERLLAKLVQQAPDFWSWRGGVFRFASENKATVTQGELPRPLRMPDPEDKHLLPLADLKELIARTEQFQGKEAPLLATLYDRLGRVYRHRLVRGEAEDAQQEQQLAIQAFEQAIALQRQLGTDASLIYSLKRLGDVYFYFKDDFEQASTLYNQALELAKTFKDGTSEADLFKVIGDIELFLEHPNAALEAYEKAVQFYHEMGDKLSEVNLLKIIGDVLLSDRHIKDWEHYEHILQRYREIGGQPLEEIGNVLQSLASRRSYRSLDTTVLTLDNPALQSDLARLDSLLTAGQWQDANGFTRTLLLKAVGREPEGWIEDKQLQYFPCPILLAIDRLWLQHSLGKFGFSIQKRLFEECNREPEAFAERVGWCDRDSNWIDASSVIYSLQLAPIGHLPWGSIQAMTLDNFILDKFTSTVRMVAKAFSKTEWQRQLIANFVAFGSALSGDEVDKEDLKRSMEYELTQAEGWWEGARLEQRKVMKLFSLFVACPDLGRV